MIAANRIAFERLSTAILFVAVASLSTARAAAPAFRVEPGQVRLFSQGKQQLLVSGVDDREIDRTSSVKYASSNPEVARVSKDGLIRAGKSGTAVVQVSADQQIQQISVIVAPADEEPPILFVTDVVPILTKLGCNSGGCHGKATGQNGFKLSLLGFEPSLDYRALVNESRGRRLFPGDADRSLILLKATGTMPHGGGRRLDTGSDDYRVLQQWLARGAAPPCETDPILQRIELSPTTRVLPTNSRQQLQVTAHLSDGTSRDVTRQAVYESNEAQLASVSSAGVVETNARNGLFAIMVRFGGQLGAFHGAIPVESSEALVGSRLADLEERLRGKRIDQLLLRQWKRLGIGPSPPADDATFIRRASIDICGTLPTREEIEQYDNDSRPDKRAALIDRLLARPEYSSYFALKWSAILRNRGAGYSTSKQRPGTALFSGWIRDSFAANKPYNQFVMEILTASGSQQENPPTVWYRSVRTLPDYVESIAQAFLGVRIQCAQCHHHPFERWSQADYYGLAAAFARVGRKGGFADAEVPTNEIIHLKDTGDVFHPRTGKLIPPRALGGPDFELESYDDPRQKLARWISKPDNPFFARTMVNRMWAHFLGRGIIHPIDDARGSNPPTNPELLDTLAQDFVANGYDVKRLIRVICNSYAYGLESAPSQWNANDSQTFARFYPRRLTAEVLLDGISQVLQVPTEFSGGPGTLPVGTRAIELPDENVPAHFLDVFGRPPRNSSCECERVDAPALAQALELVNSEEIQRKLTAENGYAQQLATNDSEAEGNVEDIFLGVFGRQPRPTELTTAVDFLESQEDLADAYRSLLWSLLATNEFMFNH